jgi:hypothetical protein
MQKLDYMKLKKLLMQSKLLLTLMHMLLKLKLKQMPSKQES